MKKNKKEIPQAYTTEYDEYEHIEYDDNNVYESDADISDLESEYSEKNEEDIILKEVEEMNNNYSFLKNKPKKNNENTKDTTKVKNNELTAI